MQIKKINLLNLNKKNLKKFFLSIGETAFRANQVMKWIYHDYCNDFNKMTNISKKLKKKLNSLAEIYAPKIINTLYSSDGTIKWIMQTKSQKTETIYIPEKKRNTLCISSQIGCILKCTFCASGQQKFQRNLTISEIIGQIWRIKKIFHKKIEKNIKHYRKITNIVIMGIGEPLLNIKNIIPAINIMLDDLGFGISKRKITISTSGIPSAIEKLSHKTDVVLALSLHAPTDKIRNKIMPINKKYNINSCLSSIYNYLKTSKANKGKITIEYVMLQNINDNIQHAHQLAKLLKKIPCKINLIPWNQIPGSYYQCSSNIQINNFFNILKKYNLIVTIRKTRGNDIHASCGQLTGKIKK
ncbi:MAG: 23S rRNA m(2)A2503 methyltransferase/tRNA m(2)A37 methyltransferase [Candidatus Westeberhardia cardiocondylae]|nr:23S rRNA m(2)A2503 methyltransferase/tRNA m(2)A37 methyltransferase [Candidatus Westeberhardia cardiocondylae]